MPPKKKGAYEMPPPIPVKERLTDLNRTEWCLGKSIGKGGFGEIYLASKGKAEDYVVKIEPYENGPLFTELACYRRVLLKEKIDAWVQQHKLKYLAIPLYIASGLHEFSKQKLRFMVMERFGKDLQRWFESDGPFREESVCYLAQRLLEALQYLHSNGYTHADIKSSNLLTGAKKGEEHQVYLVDYGLAHLYISSGEHKPLKEDPRSKHNGTLEFTSIDAHKGVSPSRRADLEILGYNLLLWSSGTLPWSKEKNPEKVARSKERYQGNARGLVNDCFGSKGPQYLVDYMSSVYSLEYTEEPPYGRLVKLFTRSGADPIKTLEWVQPVSRKRKSSEAISGPKKKMRISASEATPPGSAPGPPARPKQPAAVGRKIASESKPAKKPAKLASDLAKPVKPARAGLANGTDKAVKKSSSAAKVASPPVKPADFSKSKAFSNSHPPKIPVPVLSPTASSSSDVRRSSRIKKQSPVCYKELNSSWNE